MDTLSRNPHAITLVVVEKPTTGRAVTQALLKIGDAIDLTRTYIVHGFRHMEIPFQFPTATHWRNFPVTLEPVYRAEPDSLDLHMGFLLPAAGEQTVHLPDAEFRTMFREQSEIRLVQACDPDAVGTWFFARTCQALLGTQGFTPAFDLETLTLDAPSIDRAVKAMLEGKTNAAREVLYEGKLLQRRFEFNWWVNAHALLRPLLKLAGLPSEHALSKYELQVAYGLADHGEMTESHLYHALFRWTGTGKYKPGSIGSLTSHTRMVENLVRSGILQEVDRKWSVTARGRVFLSALPKDCRDLDLPFRLSKWCEDPNASRAKVDSYLYKWFGKVKASIPRTTERGPRKPKVSENS